MMCNMQSISTTIQLSSIKTLVKRLEAQSNDTSWLTQQYIESTLVPSEAHALDLSKRSGGINRYEAITLGHGSLTQRISDLTAKGFLFSHTTEIWIDPLGKPHYGVTRYQYLGWKPFTPALNSKFKDLSA